MRIAISVILSLILAGVLGCGSGSDTSLSGSYDVSDVNILANDIEVGEQVRVEIFFETKTEPDGTPDGVDLIVRIPPELAFVAGSSRIYDGGTEDTDAYTPDRVVECFSGETYLVYHFADIDLFDREVAGIGSFGIRFEARGKTSVLTTLVGASAEDQGSFECGSFFPAEKSEAVQVL